MALSPFISKEQIASLNKKLGQQISKDYSGLLGPKESLLVVVTLKGAMIFGSDLIREITVPMELDFVRLASYGAGTKSSGAVRFLKDMESSPEGRHLLVLDEIVDSGRTLAFLTEHLKAFSPKSVRLCSLLSKPSRREIEVNLDYLGMEIEDKFVVGYGLDFGEKYRNLPEICILT
ncbi:hypoxanthine phosphoribosyltransferase [bacterium]|nr:hypoxanthine phosphoribosyltransferase [bacterium]